jgi:putative zinc finger protein
MAPCDRFREDLAAHIYDDLDPAESRALKDHLSGCEACREELRGLQRVSLGLRSEVMFPRESEVDWEALARSTVQRATGFQKRTAAGRGAFSPAALWAALTRAPGLAAASAGLLILAGVALGTFGVLRLAPAGPAPGTVAAPGRSAEMVIPGAMLANIEQSSARGSTSRYLSESRALLMSLIATPIHCEKDSVDIKDERAKALELIRRQRLIADDLETIPLARAKEVCRDLENLFIEIASLNDCARAEQIAELRRLVESRQLMLRLDLVTDQLKKKGTTTDV